MFKFNFFKHINPATGLPMTGDGIGGVDAGGSPFGTDIHSHDHPWSSSDSGWGGNDFNPLG